MPVAVLISVGLAAMIFTATYYITASDELGYEGAMVSFVLDDGSTLDIKCDVADSYFEKVQGLQGREVLPAGTGMLFVYEEPERVAFIMPDMAFPLDIVFVAENGTVLNVEEADVEPPGTPHSQLVRYRSDGEARWVVEMNQGLGREHGIGPGTKVIVRLPS